MCAERRSTRAAAGCSEQHCCQFHLYPRRTCQCQTFEVRDYCQSVTQAMMNVECLGISE